MWHAKVVQDLSLNHGALDAALAPGPHVAFAEKPVTHSQPASVKALGEHPSGHDVVHLCMEAWLTVRLPSRPGGDIARQDVVAARHRLEAGLAGHDPNECG